MTVCAAAVAAKPTLTPTPKVLTTASGSCLIRISISVHHPFTPIIPVGGGQGKWILGFPLQANQKDEAENKTAGEGFQEMDFKVLFHTANLLVKREYC